MIAQARTMFFDPAEYKKLMSNRATLFDYKDGKRSDYACNNVLTFSTREL